MRGPVVVEEAGDVDGVPRDANGHGEARAELVHDGAGEEAKDGVDAVEGAVGDVADALRRGLAAAGAEAEHGEVDAHGEEEDASADEVLVEGEAAREARQRRFASVGAHGE